MSKNMIISDCDGKEYKVKKFEIVNVDVRNIKDKLAKAFASSDNDLLTFVNGIIKDSQINAEGECMNFDLVIVKPKDLGFSWCVKKSKFFKKAISIGLELCPAIVGPMIQIQFVRTKRYGKWWLAMSPVYKSDSCSYVIYLDTKLYHYAFRSLTMNEWKYCEACFSFETVNENEEYIFVAPKI